MKDDDLKSMLDARRRQICQQISQYPTPIAGCDVQFNRLIEQRRSVTRDIGLLEEILNSDIGQRLKAKRLSQFVHTSEHLAGSNDKHQQ